jgi:uncharacterized membrane protein YjjP (DUF1212 family)
MKITDRFKHLDICPEKAQRIMVIFGSALCGLCIGVMLLLLDIKSFWAFMYSMLAIVVAAGIYSIICAIKGRKMNDKKNVE